ncbi:hypothetical protein BY458DRAFT_495142 [Sporodiniella umbellata]|nr:hypothetical protein BY458DRAFT_495142 [Sporodiniella umbellata]
MSQTILDHLYLKQLTSNSKSTPRKLEFKLTFVYRSDLTNTRQVSTQVDNDRDYKASLQHKLCSVALDYVLQLLPKKRVRWDSVADTCFLDFTFECLELTQYKIRTVCRQSGSKSGFQNSLNFTHNRFTLRLVRNYRSNLYTISFEYILRRKDHGVL